MIYTYFELGPTPVEEDAAQLGVEADFAAQNLIETKAYMNQLMRMFPTATFAIRAFPYDHEPYREVVIMYNPGEDEEVELMLKVEAEIPMNWDDLALEELKRTNYRHLP